MNKKSDIFFYLSTYPHATGKFVAETAVDLYFETKISKLQCINEMINTCTQHIHLYIYFKVKKVFLSDFRLFISQKNDVFEPK